MKYTLLILSLFLVTSCDKLKKMEEGMQATKDGMKATQEGLRKQKLAEASKIMLDENNRKTLSPIPNNMMSAARAMGESIQADEMMLWSKNYLLKINEEVFEDSYPWVQVPSEPTAPTEPVKPTPPTNLSGPDLDDYQKSLEQYESDRQKYLVELSIYNANMRSYEEQFNKYVEIRTKFALNKAADLQMVTLVAGFLPKATLNEMITSQSAQGAYRDVLFSILKLRSNFFSQVMLEAGLIGAGKKLETIGQIEKAIEYADQIDFLCKLEFLNQVAFKTSAFDEKTNQILSTPLQKELAKKTWEKILKKSQDDFKALSFSADPLTNEKEVKMMAAQHQLLIEKIQNKLDASLK
jgi:hypothetical protein